jgi:ferredoxin
MRIALDGTRCQAYGNCQLAAPDVFHLDATTPVAAILQPQPPEDFRPQVEEAVYSCPVEALTLQED